MSKKLILVASFAASTMGLFCQHSRIELTFNAPGISGNARLDSIKIFNRTRGGDTTLYYPDHVLVLDYQLGMEQITQKAPGLQVFQNHPNPVADQTVIALYVPGADLVNITVTDILGQTVIRSVRKLDQGIHSFRFTPGTGRLYFFSARWRAMNGTIKIFNAANNGDPVSLEYLGPESNTPETKAADLVQGFTFTPGDLLLFAGHSDTLKSGILDDPAASETYNFTFAVNIPCPGIPTVDYEGKTYHTIQICSQCWLKENLNVGTMINSSQEMTDNGVIEKYCHDDKSSRCSDYGGLYRWGEVMQYSTQEGARGICPPGWHIPTDEEWKVLEGTVDGKYGIGDPEWDLDWKYRGEDAGTNLKDSFGGGGDFSGYKIFTYFWTSTETPNHIVWSRDLSTYDTGVYRITRIKGGAYSVRCLMDRR